METVTEITVVADSDHQVDAVWHSMDSLLLSWEQRFSVQRVGSEVYRLNAAAESTVAVSAQLAAMLHAAVSYGDTLTGGFDVSILPLKLLWGLDEGSAKRLEPLPIPSDSALRAACARIDYRLIAVQLTPPLVSRPPGMLIDVGGIAKGVAIEALSAALRRYGLRNYLIASGGDIRASGHRPDGTPWLIAIRHPRRSDTFLATLRLDSGCVVTSGDYERFRMTPEGRRIHHLFNPRTGAVCTSNQSVTIWSMDAVEADVLSTGLFCRSADSIISYVQQRPWLECVVVDSSGQALASRGWQQRITWHH